MPGRIQRSIEAALNPDNERSELSGEAGHRQAVVALLVEGVLNPDNEHSELSGDDPQAGTPASLLVEGVLNPLDVHAPYLSSFDP
jgi:hypothetical protein